MRSTREVSLDAYKTDVREQGAVAEALGAALDPIRALRESGYADRMELTR